MKRMMVGVFGYCLVSLLATFGRAEEPEISLLAKTGWVRIQLVLGRIEVANIGSSQTRTETRGEPDDDVRETITITSETVIPTVRYQNQSQDESLTFAIINGREVELRRMSVGADRPELRFEQSPGRDLLLQVGRDKTKKTYRSPSLWHLMLEEPGVCERELLPVLQWLQPQWRLKEFIHRAEDELVLAATGSEFQTARKARRLVARLDSADYRTRQAASRDLRALGVGLLPYLDQLDPADLSREQRQRLSRLEASLRASTGDSPQRIANWLAEDERTWLTLLEHREPAVRQIAVAHLGKRFPKSFAAGSSADPETLDPEAQLRRIARLKAKYQVR